MNFELYDNLETGVFDDMLEIEDFVPLLSTENMNAFVYTHRPG